MHKLKTTVGAIFILVLITACGGDEETNGGSESSLTPGSTTAGSDLNPTDFSGQVDNPFFPLRPSSTFVYEGEETDPDTGETVELRVEETVRADPDTVAGIEVAVLEVKEFEDGELVESTRDFHSQHRDGTVYYIGEEVDDYEDGQIVGHHGAWLHGEDGAQAGIFMPSDPQVGDEFEQERAPGVAEDISKVVAVDEEVTVPAGTFTGCIKTEDLDPLSDTREFKYYCPDVGLVREEFADGKIELVSYE